MFDDSELDEQVDALIAAIDAALEEIRAQKEKAQRDSWAKELN